MIKNVKHLGRNIVITLGEEAMALTSTVDGGLKHGIKYVIYHQVPKNFMEDPTREAVRTHGELSIRSGEAITFLTATELPRNHTIYKEVINGVEIETSITMGLSNPYRIGRGDVITEGLGESTINMAIIINKPLTVQAMIDAITLAAQVKALTLAELSGGNIHGTTSDAIALLTPTNGDKEPYAGPATIIGKAMIHTVYNALIKAYETYTKPKS